MTDDDMLSATLDALPNFSFDWVSALKGLSYPDTLSALRRARRVAVAGRRGAKRNSFEYDQFNRQVYLLEGLFAGMRAGYALCDDEYDRS